MSIANRRLESSRNCYAATCLGDYSIANRRLESSRNFGLDIGFEFSSIANRRLESSRNLCLHVVWVCGSIANRRLESSRNKAAKSNNTMGSIANRRLESSRKRITDNYPVQSVGTVIPPGATTFPRLFRPGVGPEPSAGVLGMTPHISARPRRNSDSKNLT